jgi:cytochrome c biogenesis protein CcdA
MAKKKTSTVSTRLFVATMIFLFLLSISALCILASTFSVTINYSMNSSWITFIFVVFLLSLTCAILLLVTIKKVKEKANQKPKPKKPKPEKPSSESGNNNAVPTTEKTCAVNETNSPDEDDDSDDDDDDSDDDDDAIMQLFSSENSVKDSVIARINENLVKMKEYYTWSQEQAKAMFSVAISTCIAGFGMIVASLLLSIYLKLNFEAALFTAIGGMVTEVFGGTTLLVYRSTVSQLNHYHKSMHEDQRSLFAAELTGVIKSKDLRNEMLEAIIRNALRLNIILAQEKEETTEKTKPATADNEKPAAADASGQTTASNASGSEEKPKKP